MDNDDNVDDNVEHVDDEVQLSNNISNPYMRYKNFKFNLKTKGKMSASFVCANAGCFASVSLRGL